MNAAAQYKLLAATPNVLKFVHPEDLAAAELLKPEGKVFALLTVQGEYLKVRYDNFFLRIKESALREIPGEGLFFDDLVIILVQERGPRNMLHKGRICGILHQPHWNKLAYLIIDSVTQHIRQYVREDLRKVTNAFATREITYAIIEEPENLEAWAVYGDALLTQDDPRGELIMLELELLNSPNNTSLQNSISTILNENEATWTEGFNFPDMISCIQEISFKFGYIHDLELKTQRNSERCIRNTAKHLLTILNHESARFIHNLSLKQGLSTPYTNHRPIMEVFHMARHVSGIRNLILNLSELGDLKPIFTLLPNLESLTLVGAVNTFTEPGHQNLKELTINLKSDRGFDAQRMVGCLAGANLPALKSLNFVINNSMATDNKFIETLHQLFNQRSFPALDTLTLYGFTELKPIIQVLASSQLLPQLKSLALPKIPLDISDAYLIIQNAKTFSNLKDFSYNDTQLQGNLQKELQDSLK